MHVAPTLFMHTDELIGCPTSRAVQPEASREECSLRRWCHMHSCGFCGFESRVRWPTECHAARLPAVDTRTVYMCTCVC